MVSLQQKRLAVPVDAAVAATTDLCCIVFYFLLRVGETPGRRIHDSRAKQAPPHHPIPSTRCFILEEQADHTQQHAPCHTNDGRRCATHYCKNGFRGSVIFHSIIDDIVCPVKALAHRISNALVVDPRPETNSCRTTAQATPNIMQKHITKAVHHDVIRLDLNHQYFTEQNTRSHSLRAGGGDDVETQWRQHCYNYEARPMDQPRLSHLHP
jgi:hypothetical protein